MKAIRRWINTHEPFMGAMCGLLLGLSLVVGAEGCTLSESGRQGARFISDSTESAANNATPEKKPGMQVVSKMAKQVSREAGEPKEKLTPIDFSQDTRFQEAVQAANQKAEGYKKELDTKAQTVFWLKGILLAALGSMGGFGAIIAKVLRSASAIKKSLRERERELMSVVEGTRAVISHAKTAKTQVLAAIEAHKRGESVDWSSLAHVGEETVKSIMREYQMVHKTWDGVQDMIGKIKKAYRGNNVDMLKPAIST